MLADRLYVSKFTIVVLLGAGYLIYAASGGGSGAPPKAASGHNVLRQSECKQSAAQLKIAEAQAKGAIERVTVFNDEVTVIISAATWYGIKLETKMGLISAVDCAIAGEGKFLRAVVVLSPNGSQLGMWDGISQKLEVK